MRAIVIPSFGGPEVLTLREMPDPHPGPQQVNIRVAYAGVNFGDIMDRQRGYRIKDQLPYVPGLEVSGSIHEIGAGVEGLREGQPVAAFVKSGGYAELALAQADLTFPLESQHGQLDLAVAAAFPTVVPTAYDILVHVARLQPGETVLIDSASGGVGIIAGQLARTLGAGLVLGMVGSAQKVAYARSFGYDHVFLRDNFVEAVHSVTGGRGVDVVFNAAGEPTRSQSLSLLAPFGRLIHFGNASGNPDVPIEPSTLLTGNKGILGYSISNLSRVAPKLLAATAHRAVELLATGQIRIDITGTIPLEQAALAHHRMESNTHTGKLLLQVQL
ncbi:NADPH:quinone reductase [Reticulibacter mediterranei]|uniref:NADPH:quinone reductase n=1 Tax=Reticulibacter mediterranei TaxID=2778369 RepID=A0A8J3IWV2_9CHLR|nr:zinc-binding dehydrogenase [Reticulibacter mediterranei]GHO99980.1 NADPH:quinone reductase [Reticulibacter mediterranei]